MTNQALEAAWSIPRLGETIGGKYVVEGTCGRGGLAVVLSATHIGLDRRVAIKMLLPEWTGDADVIERFLREGRAATRIKSEHVVRVFDVGTLDGGAPYLVLEYLEGSNLDEVVAQWGPLPVATAIDWVMQASEAIAEAHAYGIIHRDLKPANLFLTRRADGSACVKVIDFGLSKLTDPRLSDGGVKLTRPTDVMGSPHYMAPEQLRATCDADARADLWALGAVLHELMVGQPPFRGETMPEICATVLTQPPARVSSLRPDVPPPVEQAILRCLEKAPEARFATVAELAKAIAPFGSVVAQASRERIERVLETGGRPSEISLPPPTGAPREDSEPRWPSDAYRMRPTSDPASGRVVLGAFLMLAGIGFAMFMWMYTSVHGGEQRRDGVTARQPNAPSASTTTALIAPPETPPASATATPTATATATATPTATATATPTATATATPTPTATPTATATATPTATPAPTALVRPRPQPYALPHPRTIVRPRPQPQLVPPTPAPVPPPARETPIEPPAQSADDPFAGRK
jgi:serine/threonine-protein kinase